VSTSKPQALGVDELRRLIAATAGVTGDDFFHALVKTIGELLGMRRVFAGELRGARIRPLAAWRDDTRRRVRRHDAGSLGHGRLRRARAADARPHEKDPLHDRRRLHSARTRVPRDDASAVIEKPFEPDELRRTVAAMLS
jgi:integrase